MGKRKYKGGSKKSKSKKCREKNSKVNTSQKEEKNSQNEKYEGIYETTSQDNLENDSDIHTKQERPLADDLNYPFSPSTSKTSSDTESQTSDTNTNESTTESNSDSINETNDCYEEIKAKQQELLNNIKNLSETLIGITLIRDNINSLRVDNLTEIYFTRQLRPLLDALNIIAFSVSNMTSAAVNIQANTFGDRKEIRHALSLSYKMNDEVEDIINALGRRVKIFVNEIDKNDKNCPPFD
ncbi:hypothetical protein DIC82_00895 [Clostridium beijerinckii]|nr:hypothetical protein DIC82_00895 [Clostridium beijerinckii]